MVCPRCWVRCCKCQNQMRQNPTSRSYRFFFQRQVFSCISSRILCCTFQKFQDCHDDHHKIHVDIVLLKNIRFHSKTFKSSAETGFPYMPGSYLDQDKRMIYPLWYFFMEMPETLVFVFQMRYRCFRI